MILICIFIAFNSCINNLNEYGTSNTLKSRPYLVTFKTFMVLLSMEPENFTGPSAIGLMNNFLDGLYIANIPVLLHTAILYLSERSIIDSRKNSDTP